MTASILYEAVEPHIVWKQLLAAILNELVGDGLQHEVRRVHSRVNFDTHSFVDIGNPFGSLHPEDHTCSRRRDSSRPLASCILCPLRSPPGWNAFTSPVLDLTPGHVRFRSQVM